QRTRQHGNDSRYMKEALGDDENAVSERQSESGLSEAVVANPWNDRQQRPPGEHSEQTAADKRHEEFFQPGAYVQLASGSDHTEQDGEQRNRGGIVEQSFAFEQAGQARWD